MTWGMDSSDQDTDGMDELGKCLARIAELLREDGPNCVSAVGIRVGRDGVRVALEGDGVAAAKDGPLHGAEAAGAIRGALGRNGEARGGRLEAERRARPHSQTLYMELANQSALMGEILRLGVPAGRGADAGAARREVIHALFDAGLEAVTRDPAHPLSEGYWDSSRKQVLLSGDRHDALRGLPSKGSRPETLRWVLEAGYLSLSRHGRNPLVPKRQGPRKPSAKAALAPLPRRRAAKGS